MRRAPIVVASTAAGLGLVLSFHTRSPKLSRLSTAAPAGTSPASTPSTSPTTTAPAAARRPGAPSATTTPATAAPPTTAAATRTVTGQEIQYQYGDIQLRVTERGTRILNVTVLRNDAADFRSQQINQQAVPILQEQALAAQSANIDGVSGATFTSAAYAQSLQSALDQANG